MQLVSLLFLCVSKHNNHCLTLQTPLSGFISANSHCAASHFSNHNFISNSGGDPKFSKDTKNVSLKFGGSVYKMISKTIVEYIYLIEWSSHRNNGSLGFNIT